LSEPVEAGHAPEAAPAAVVPRPGDKKHGSALWREVKGMAVVIAAVLGFHSFIAKPFYIPSESMMPVLLKGDRLVVTKYAYGWSFVSPTIPNPLAILRSVVLRRGPEPWGITLPFMEGRLFGRMPARGDVVIVTPPGANEDYIKRVIGLPGDTIEVRGGRLVIGGKLVRYERRPPAMVAIDANAPCGMEFAGFQVASSDGTGYCRLPIVRETLPDGVTYDTIDLGNSPGDDFGPIAVPAGHVFLMGDNRDRSADSRFSLAEQGLGGPVPWENIGGRAEFITFSLDGSTRLLAPATWFTAFRGGRAGNSLRSDKK
jgi:signal peptidase I